MGWALGLLAIVAPVSALVAKASGEELYNRLIDQGMSGPGKEILDDHMGYGDLTFWFSLALGVVSLAMVFLTLRRTTPLPRAAELGGAAVMIVLAALAGYYVFLTGDSGATAVWGTY